MAAWDKGWKFRGVSEWENKDSKGECELKVLEEFSIGNEGLRFAQGIRGLKSKQRDNQRACEGLVEKFNAEANLLKQS